MNYLHSIVGCVDRPKYSPTEIVGLVFYKPPATPRMEKPLWEADPRMLIPSLSSSRVMRSARPRLRAGSEKSLYLGALSSPLRRPYDESSSSWVMRLARDRPCGATGWPSFVIRDNNDPLADSSKASDLRWLLVLEKASPYRAYS